MHAWHTTFARSIPALVSGLGDDVAASFSGWRREDYRRHWGEKDVVVAFSPDEMFQRGVLRSGLRRLQAPHRQRMRFDAFLDAQAEEGVGEPSPDLASSDRPRNRPAGRVGAGHPAAGARRCPAVPVARPVRLRPPSASSSGGGVRSLPGAFPEVSHRPPSAASLCRGARLAHAAGACAASGWRTRPRPFSDPSRSPLGAFDRRATCGWRPLPRRRFCTTTGKIRCCCRCRSEPFWVTKDPVLHQSWLDSPAGFGNQALHSHRPGQAACRPTRGGAADTPASPVLSLPAHVCSGCTQPTPR